MSCRSRLATLNERLTTLERRVEYIEAKVWHISSLYYVWILLVKYEEMDFVLIIVVPL